jgi:hypothetical protein
MGGKTLAAGALIAALAAFPSPARAFVVSLFNPTQSEAVVELFVIGPDLECRGLGERPLPAGGAVRWDTGKMCPGGLGGRIRGTGGWRPLAETSCLGAERPRSNWTACCHDLAFTLCPRPGVGVGFCPR